MNQALSSSHPTRSSIKPRPRRRSITTATTRLSESRRHRSNRSPTIPLLLLLLVLRLLVLVLILLEIGIRGRFPGGALLELFLFFELDEIAFEAFEVAGGGLDKVFGLVGGFQGFEHGADL